MVPKERVDNPLLKANIFSRLSYWWMNNIFFKGFKKDLEFSDIYKVLPKDRGNVLGEKLEKLWDKEVEKCKIKNKKLPTRAKPYRPSLLNALIRQFMCEYMMGGLIGFFEECVLRMAQPICLAYMIKYFTNPNKYTVLEGNLFAGGVVLIAIALIFTHHAYFHGISHVGGRVRIACSALVFRKVLRLSQSSLGDTTVGQFVNLLSNDVSRFEMGTIFFHYFWIGPIQTAIATVFLWGYFGSSCLVGLFILLVFIPFQGYMGKLFSRLRAETALKTDKRIRIMNEIVNGMRVIKLYTWEKPFSILVNESRRDEIKVIRKTSTLRAINMSMFFAASKIIIFFTLLTFVLRKGELTAENVFVSLAFYNNIRLNMTLFFPSAISTVAEALVSIRRIENILLMEEKKTNALQDANSNDNLTKTDEAKCIIVEHFSGKWNLKYPENTLTDISFIVKAGELMAIIGHVGAGKGSIIQAILKELPATIGNIYTNGTLAYTAQEPWIFAGSIRENILFGKAYDTKWYEEVAEACALTRDFTLFPYGDRTLVGDRGSSLSGGQKARINLARAVYADADIYLLDDPLSAVDAEVGRHLFEKCINGILKMKVRILVTHQLQFLKSIDHIILIENGKIQIEGSYDKLIVSGIDFAQLLESNKERTTSFSSPQHFSNTSIYGTSPNSPHGRVRTTSENSLNSTSTFAHSRHETLTLVENSILGPMYPHDEILDPDEEELNSIKAVLSISRVSPKKVSIDNVEETVEFLPTAEEETKSIGTVKWNLYYQYFRAGSNCCTMSMLVISNLIAQLLFTGADYWLNIWTNSEAKMKAGTLQDHTENPVLQSLKTDREIQIGFYSGLVAGVFITSFWRTVLFFRLSLNSSISLHNSMFQGIIRAPMRFFEVNPAGRILNRFSSAMGEMDDSLPPAFFDALGIILSVMATVIMIAIVNPILLGPAVLLAIMLYFLRKFYLRTARSIKRLEGVARSPVFSHLSAALNGLPTIRAFKSESKFVKQFDDHLNFHSGSWYLFITSTRWFGFWLDWISALFIASVTFSFMLGHGDGPTDGSKVGLLVSSVIQLSGMFQWGIRQSAEVENQMISVERVMEYTRIKPEAALESESDKKPAPDWPTHGEIIMTNVTLQYGDALPVLQDITCSFHSCEKVGIVGRTGAGKSSLITALFRITEPTGKIFIDGVNVLNIGLHDLRAKISIIPQDPVLFMGSLRRNLDPFDSYTDSEIWNVLGEIHLAAEVKSLPYGLELEITEGGSNFSVGQRQLVCLARAILKQSKILILDEATANVDPETDALIQKTIRINFLNCTVLTVAHRLNTVMDSDRILVLDAGHIKEFDEPFVLLQDKGSELNHLIQETGKDSANNLYAIAKAAMEKRHSIQPTQTRSIHSGHV